MQSLDTLIHQYGTDKAISGYSKSYEYLFNDIKNEVTTSVKRYLPNLSINDLTVEQSTESEYAAVVTIKYTITDNVFSTQDIIIINI